MFKYIFALSMLLASAAIAQEKVSGGLRVDQYSVVVGSSEERWNGPSVPRQYRVWLPKDSDERGYVYLNHLDEYQLQLRSFDRRRCDAKVEIDGKEIGTFRLDGVDNIVVSRSVVDRGKLTFLRNGTQEFFDAALDKVSRADRGLVKVTFYPEVVAYGAKPTALASGGTGTTGQSDQHFREVGSIARDEANAVVIYLRLAERERAVAEPVVRPLEGIRSNKIPEPIRD